MAVVEVIYVVAAVLWIVVVVAALGTAARYLVKLRARRRRMNRLIVGVRRPLERTVRPYTATAAKTAVLVQGLVSGFGPDARMSASSATRRRFKV